IDSIAAATGWPNSPTRATSQASPPASGAAVVTSTGVPASFMACTSRRVLLRSNPTCSMGPGRLPSRLPALTSSVLRGEAPVFMAFSANAIAHLRGGGCGRVGALAPAEVLRRVQGDNAFRPLEPAVGSVLPSGAGVSVVAIVGDHYSSGQSGGVWGAAGAEARRRRPSFFLSGLGVSPTVWCVELGQV